MGKSKDTVAVIRTLGAEIRRAQWFAQVHKCSHERAQDQLEQAREQLRDTEDSLAAMERCPECGSRMVRWELTMSDCGPDREVVLSCGACDSVWQRTGFADFWSGIKDVLALAAEEAEEGGASGMMGEMHDCGEPLNRIEVDANEMRRQAAQRRAEGQVWDGSDLERWANDHDVMLQLLRGAEAIIGVYGMGLLRAKAASGAVDEEQERVLRECAGWAIRAEQVCGWRAFWREEA